jgi:hypothetical protein
MPETSEQARDELELKKYLDDHQYAYAIAALQAQERDREAERVHNRHGQQLFLKLVCGIGFVVMVITIAAFSLNKENFLLECLKYMFIGGGGGGLGYVIGWKRGRK